MTRTSKILIAVALSVGLVGGAAAYGKHKFGDSEKRRAHVISHISDELDLNDTQVTNLNILIDQMMTVKSQMRAELGDDIEGMNGMITAEQFDQSKALDMINTKADAIKQNAPGVVAAMGNFLDGLNAEQKAEIAEHIEKKKRRHREHRGHGKWGDSDK